MSYMSISCLYNNYYLLWAKLSFSNAFVVIFLEWDDKLLQFKFDKSIETNEVQNWIDLDREQLRHILERFKLQRIS